MLLIRVWALIFCSIVSMLPAQGQSEQHSVEHSKAVLQRSKIAALEYYLKVEKTQNDLQDVDQKLWQAYLNKQLLPEVNRKTVPAEVQQFLDSMFNSLDQAVASQGEQAFFADILNLEKFSFMHYALLGDGSVPGVFSLPAPYDSWLFFMGTFPSSFERVAGKQNIPFALQATNNLKNISRPFVHDQLRQYCAENKIEGIQIPFAYFYHLPGHGDDVNDFNYAICVNSGSLSSEMEKARGVLNEHNSSITEQKLKKAFESFAVASSIYPFGGNRLDDGSYIASVNDVFSTSLLMDYLQIPSLSGAVNMLMPMTTLVLAFPIEIKVPHFELFNLFLLADFYYHDEFDAIYHRCLAARKLFFAGQKEASSEVLKEKVEDCNKQIGCFNDSFGGLLAESLIRQEPWMAFLADASTLQAERVISPQDEFFCEIALVVRKLLLSMASTPRSSQEIFKALLVKREHLRTLIPVRAIGGVSIEAQMLMTFQDFLFPYNKDGE